jgi:exopolysaccharide production protein ExoZ
MTALRDKFDSYVVSSAFGTTYVRTEAEMCSTPVIRATPPAAARLSGIQGLRGIAAVAVVLSHAARHVNMAFGMPVLITAFQAGHAGVDLFFVISGFIILFVHHRDIGQPSRLCHYLGRRFNRVMPLYWVALGLTVGLSAVGGHSPPTLPWFL